MKVKLLIFALLFGGFIFVWAQSASDSGNYPDAREYAPNFWFDSEEKYYPASPLDFYYNEDLEELGGNEAKQKYDNLSQEEKLNTFKVFYKIDDSGRELVYQYWLFYVFNKSGNEHYGDWESVSVFVDEVTSEVNRAVGSFHQGGSINNETSGSKLIGSEHIWNYVAKGSHANCVDYEADGNCNSFIWKSFERSWSSTDKLYGLKVEHDSPYYDLRPISEIKDVFGKKYDEDRPLITKEKSPTLGMLPLKFGKKRFHVLPLGGDPPQNAWNKKEYEDPEEALPLTPLRLAEAVSEGGTRFARNVGGFFKDVGSAIAGVGLKIASPITNLFTAAVTTEEEDRSLTSIDLLMAAFNELDQPTDAPIIARGLTPFGGQTPDESAGDATPSDVEGRTPAGGTTPTPDKFETEIAFVSRVIDGDTVELLSGQKLRYIGINAPEMLDECFADEATQRNRELVENKQVILLEGPTDTDKYGRLLRFVWQDANLNGTINSSDLFVNLELVAGGYAHAFDFGEEHAYDHVLEAAEAKAKRERQGFWSDACNSLKQKDDDSSRPIVRIFELPPSSGDIIPQDTMPPAAPILSIQDNTTFNAASDANGQEDGYQIILSGAAEAGSLIVITQNPTYTATTTQEGEWLKEVTLQEGVNTFSITATDSSENISASTTLAISLDSIAPTTTIVVANYTIDSPEFQIHWSADAQDLDYYDAQYKIGTSSNWQDWITNTDDTEKDYINATTNTYYFRVRGVDIHQNIGDWQETSVVIDLYSIVINEIQLDNAEFVELYNPTSNSISLEGYYFSYYPSNRTEWSGTSAPHGPWLNKVFPEDAEISARGYYLIGVKDYPASAGNPNSDWDLGYSSGKLNNSKGTVAIFPFNPKTATTSQYAYDNRVDAVGWDTSTGSGQVISLYEQSQATTTPSSGESFTRDSNHTDTNNNSSDFQAATISPTNSSGEIYDPNFSLAPVWQMYQGSARHSGLAALSGPSWSNTSQAASSWIFSMDAGGSSQPIIDYLGIVYAMDGRGKVYAINPDGTQKWKFEPQVQGGDGAGWTSGSPVLSSDSQYVYSTYTTTSNPYKLVLYSIKAIDGSLNWKYSPSESGYNQSFTSPVADANGNIYVASKSKLYSISPSGSLNSGWPFTPISQFSSSAFWIRIPAIAKEEQNEYVYITAQMSNNAGDRYIFKVDISDGTEATGWPQNPTGNNALFNGVSINATGTIYTGGYLNIGTSGLFAVDPSDGSKIWSNNVGDSLSPIVPNFDTDGNIYIGTIGAMNSGALHKVNATGTLQWTFTPAAPSAMQYPAVIDSQSRVYVGAKNKSIYVLDSSDGVIIWQYELSGEPRGFAVGNGAVYVVSYDGRVYALGD